MSDEDNLVIKAEAKLISTFPRVFRSKFPISRDLPLCIGCLKARCRRGTTFFHCILTSRVWEQLLRLKAWTDSWWVSKTHVLYNNITWVCISNPLAADWKLGFALLGGEFQGQTLRNTFAPFFQWLCSR